MNNKYFLKLFILCFFSLMGTELIFKGLSFELFDKNLIRILLFTISTSLVVTYIASLFKEKIAKTIIVLFNFIISIYGLVQITFKSFMGNYMSFGMLSNNGVGRVSAEVKTFLGSITIKSLTILLPTIITLLIFIFLKKWFSYEKTTKTRKLVLLSIVVIVYIATLLTLNIKALDNNLELKSAKQLYYNPNMVDLSLKNIGVNRFLLRDIINIFNDNKELVDVTPVSKPTIPTIVEPDYKREIDDSDWDELIKNEKDSVINNLHQFYKSQNITSKNAYTGMFKDKNLILIMVEALDLSAIDENLTPTLYRLTKEGWYFNNYYAPKYSCTTGESEFIALTSIIPSNATCTPFTYQNNDYPTSIFNLFNKAGYTSTSYHGWSDKYYPRTNLHKHMGSTFYNASKLNINTNGGWSSDVETITKAYDIFSKNDKYFSFIITVSMHFSYDFDDSITRRNWNKVKNLDTGISMKRYLAKAIEFDKALEQLLKNLEEDGELDDTVIAIFGDHHPYNLDFSYLAKRSNVDRYEDLNEDLMPFIIYNSEQKPKVISKTSSTFDILPTLANLFDLDYDPRYYTGKDIFSNEASKVIFSNGSWVTDNAIYFASTGKYKLKNEEVGEDYISKTNKEIGNLFTVSENTLKKNYFKYRFK